jgi:hypoxanthine phosphoribosyltransferase
MVLLAMASHQGEIRRIAWQTIRLWIRELAIDQDQWDCIVGVSRGGLPLAITLSYYCDSKPLEFLHKAEATAKRTPFYVFGAGRQDRLDDARRNFRLTTGGRYHRPLVIDDVTTFGDTLTVAEELLAAEGVTEARFATYAADLTVLSRERPELATRVRYAIDIDNSKVWLSFPWQRDDVP